MILFENDYINVKSELFEFNVDDGCDKTNNLHKIFDIKNK